jgi:dethiobiotin synthetase
MTRRLVLLGTGTGIGKTHTGVALVSALASTGAQVAGLKPIESGVDGSSPTDASALATPSTFHVQPSPYALPDPVSPHLAARRAGITLDLATVRTWVDAHRAAFLIIETAGALLSPIGPGRTNLDLARSLDPHVLVLVASDRLGVLHDVAATLLALRTLAPTLPAPVVVLQPPAVPDSSTGTNADELVTLGIVQARPVTFPRAESTTPESLAAAREVLRLSGMT